LPLEDGNTMLGEQYRDGSNLEARVRLHERFSSNPVGLHPWLLAQIDLPSHASVLELGCGVGSFWVTNREHIPPGWRMTLTDLSPGMVREAARRLSGHRPGFTFAMASAEELPYPDATFDAVFAHFMLYHVGDRPRAMRKMARVLRPGGQLYAATNGARHMQEAWLLAMRARLMPPADVAAGDAAIFSLENGADQLRTAFADVALRRYEDRLVVTETEPLLAYLLSTATVQAELAHMKPDVQHHRIAGLRALIDQQLEGDGQIVVAKDSGVFVARPCGSRVPVSVQALPRGTGVA
jgi:SAM-dependent methyltransferase